MAVSLDPVRNVIGGSRRKGPSVLFDVFKQSIHFLFLGFVPCLLVEFGEP